MSDTEEFSDPSEDEEKDFSASEDEWTPGGKFDDDVDSDEEEDADATLQGTDENFNTNLQKKIKKKSGKSFDIKKNNKKLKRKSLGNNSLRAKMFKKYQPPPKVVRSSPLIDGNNPTTSKNDNSPSFTGKIKPKDDDFDSDSSSSVDGGLVNANDLDLRSSFFDIANPNTKPISPCDDSDEDEEEEEEQDVEDANDVDEFDDDDDDSGDIDPAKVKNTESPFKKFYDFHSRFANKSVKKPADQSNNNDNNEDIAQLLSMGENSKASQSKIDTKELKNLNKIDKNENSDSDWEKVEENEKFDTCKKEDESIQIIVEHPKYVKQQKKTTDEEASLMRKLNRIIKENQLIKHKTSLLCQIAHGNVLNRVLNNPILMSKALTILPNGSKCYPDGKTEIGYFESIAKWYNSKIKIKSYDMYSDLNDKSTFLKSLEIQIENKEALCKKSFVLIFIVLLRAMGIQCRMIINLVTLPIRPLQEDLCTIKMKRKVSETKKVKNNVRPTETVRTIEKIKKKPDKIEPRIIKPSAVFDEVLEQVSKVRKDILISKKSIQDGLPKSSSTVIKNINDKNDENCFESKSTEVENKKSNKRELRSQKIVDDDWQPTTSKKVKTEVINVVKNNRITRNLNKNENMKLKASIPKNTKTVIEKNSRNTERDSGKAINNKTEATAPVPKIRVLKNKNNKDKVSENSSAIKSMESKSPKTLASAGTSRKRTPSPKFHISPFFIPSNKQTENKLQETKIATRSKSARIQNKLDLPQMDGADDTDNLDSKSDKNKESSKKTNLSEGLNSDDDFAEAPKINLVNKLFEGLKTIDHRVLSTDDEASTSKATPPKKKNGMDIWVEVYCEKEDQWITIDIFHTKVHCVDTLRKKASPPVSYVFGWNNDDSLKDVSPRYCPDWNTVTRKNRVEKAWLDEAIKKYLGKKNARDVSEDRELDKIHIDKPLPKTINEFKNHPLYALKRHLLKFEALYPVNPPTLGFVRGEPIYPRDCVHLCHSREIWLKEARVVKPGEKAYKVVKARPKWDKLTGSVISNLPLDIFGYWQTSQYEPPVAENGIVPRNAYGNVELFKACMLPKKTVHLRLNGLPRVCKKLNVDCASAVIGFDFHQGSCHPMLDGFVICEEFEEEVVAAWHKEQEEIERKEQEKYEQRVYGNWKKLIKGLYIRQKLKLKYNFESTTEADMVAITEADKSSITEEGKPSTSADHQLK